MTDSMPYEILGAVPPEQMPDVAKVRRQGIWTGLADKAIEDHAAGFVTVVRVANDDDFVRLRNGIRLPIRDRNPNLRIVYSTAPKDGGLQVYIRLVKL